MTHTVLVSPRVHPEHKRPRSVVIDDRGGHFFFPLKTDEQTFLIAFPVTDPSMNRMAGGGGEEGVKRETDVCTEISLALKTRETRASFACSRGEKKESTTLRHDLYVFNN